MAAMKSGPQTLFVTNPRAFTGYHEGAPDRDSTCHMPIASPRPQREYLARAPCSPFHPTARPPPAPIPTFDRLPQTAAVTH
jgi:hypothetical protein